MHLDIHYYNFLLKFSVFYLNPKGGTKKFVDIPFRIRGKIDEIIQNIQQEVYSSNSNLPVNNSSTSTIGGSFFAMTSPVALISPVILA